MKGTSLSYAQAAKSGDSETDKSVSPTESAQTEVEPSPQLAQLTHQNFFPSYLPYQYFPQPYYNNQEIDQLKAMAHIKVARKGIKIVDPNTKKEVTLGKENEKTPNQIAFKGIVIKDPVTGLVITPVKSNKSKNIIISDLADVKTIDLTDEKPVLSAPEIAPLALAAPATLSSTPKKPANVSNTLQKPPTDSFAATLQKSANPPILANGSFAATLQKPAIDTLPTNLQKVASGSFAATLQKPVIDALPTTFQKVASGSFAATLQKPAIDTLPTTFQKVASGSFAATLQKPAIDTLPTNLQKVASGSFAATLQKPVIDALPTTFQKVASGSFAATLQKPALEKQPSITKSVSTTSSKASENIVKPVEKKVLNSFAATLQKSVVPDSPLALSSSQTKASVEKTAGPVGTVQKSADPVVKKPIDSPANIKKTLSSTSSNTTKVEVKFANNVVNVKPTTAAIITKPPVESKDVKMTGVKKENVIGEVIEDSSDDVAIAETKRSFTVKFGQVSPATQASPATKPDVISQAELKEVSALLANAKDAEDRVVINSPADMEDGEIEDEGEGEETFCEKYLPNASPITVFSSIIYPECLECTLPSGSDYKYTVEFLKEIGKLIVLPPSDLSKMIEYIGDEKHIRRSASMPGNKAPQMSRVSSNTSQRKYNDNRDRDRSLNDRDRKFGHERSHRGMREGRDSRDGRDGRNGNDRPRGGDRGGDRGGGRRPTADAPPPPSNRPLQRIDNAWVPVKKESLAPDESVVKLVKGLLNKLTVENFEKISGKFLLCEIANDEVLRMIIELIFEKALDEPHFGAMYARLCQFLMHKLPEIHSWIANNISNNNFRGALVRKCQAEFESSTKWATMDDDSKEARAERRRNIASLTAEEKIAIAEEDYQRAKAKRHSLGNTQFIGELYIHGMISEKIIHTCIVGLLKKDDPEEEEVETLCKLLNTIGKRLEENSSTQMNTYFSELMVFATHKALSSRIRFKVLDLIDLRKSRWVPRSTTNTGPLKIAQVHKEAEMQKRKEEQDRLMSRSGSRRRGDAAPNRIQAPMRRNNDSKTPMPMSDAEGWTSVTRTVSSNDSQMSRSGSRGGINKIAKVDEPTKVLNPYQILQRTQHMGEIESADHDIDDEDEGQNEAFEETTNEKSDIAKLVVCYKEFKEILDAISLVDEFKKILPDASPLVSKLVSISLQHLLDVNGKCASAVTDLYTIILGEYNPALVWDAFKEFLVAFEIDSSDFPNGFKNMAEVLVPLYLTDLLSPKIFLEFATPLSKYEGINPVGPNFLAAFLGSLNPEELIEFMSQDIDLNPFWSNNLNDKNFAMWVSRKKLPLIATISSIARTLLESSTPFQLLKPDGKPSYDARLSRAFLIQVCNETIFLADPLIPTDNSPEMFEKIKSLIYDLQGIIASFTDAELVHVLIETDRYLTLKSIQKNYLESFFYIYYEEHLEIIPKGVFEIYKTEHASPESLRILDGWFKGLDREKDSQDQALIELENA